VSASDAGTGYDLSLLGLSARVKQFAGHIEDMGDDERVFLLGLFAGTADQLRDQVRKIYAKAGADGYMDALPPLHQVMLALGAPEDWAEDGQQ
jgi:hypothetical protein